MLRGPSGNDVVLDIDGTLPLQMLKALAEEDVSIPASEMVISKSGRALSGDETALQDLGLNDGDVLAVSTTAIQNVLAGLGSLKPPKSQLRRSAEELVSSMSNNPYSLSLLKQNNPRLAEAVENRDWASIERQLKEMEDRKREREREIERQRRILAQNPFDERAQRMIEEQIQLENVERARQDALEFMPEAFASVTMLYINVRVNGVPLKAFVDSGAQMTIMSTTCAERCGLMRLVDRRFQGMAVGVGQQKIVGRIHMAQMQIGESHLPVSFSVLENQPMDILLGLDMLKRHQCCIDLKNNCLTIGTTNTTTQFLSEGEIPKSERLESHSPASQQQQGQFRRRLSE